MLIYHHTEGFPIKIGENYKLRGRSVPVSIIIVNPKLAVQRFPARQTKLREINICRLGIMSTIVYFSITLIKIQTVICSRFIFPLKGNPLDFGLPKSQGTSMGGGGKVTLGGWIWRIYYNR